VHAFGNEKEGEKGERQGTTATTSMNRETHRERHGTDMETSLTITIFAISSFHLNRMVHLQRDERQDGNTERLRQTEGKQMVFGKKGERK
jgi:hypothetical protein